MIINSIIFSSLFNKNIEYKMINVNGRGLVRDVSMSKNESLSDWGIFDWFVTEFETRKQILKINDKTPRKNC